MRSGQRGRGRAMRLAGLLAGVPALAVGVLAVGVLAVGVLAVGVLAAGLPGGLGQVTALAGPASAGAAPAAALTSLTLTSVGSDQAAADAPSTQADVAADGRYVAFQSRAALSVTASAGGGRNVLPYGHAATSRIYVRDLVGGSTTLLSDPADGDATAPAISANGALVSYEQGGNVYVADRQATGSGLLDTPGNLVVRQVTGTANDLDYEHLTACPARLRTGQGRVTPCGPRLSSGGSTLVYPAVLTPVSPELAVTASFDDGDPALTGDLLDFTPYDGDAGTYGDPYGEATVAYVNTGRASISFGDPGVTVTEPPGDAQDPPFTVSGDNCAGTFDPGGSCTIEVTFGYDACDDYANQQGLVSGDLMTHAGTPAGQSILELAGFCDADETSSAYRTPAARGRAPATATAAYRTGATDADCPAPPSGLALTALAPAADDQGAPLADAGAADAGRPYVGWTTIQAPPDQGQVDVDFQSANDADCQLQLIDPARLRLKLADPLPAGAPRPCYQGEPLSSPEEGGPSSGARQAERRPAAEPPDECTAYVLISPDAVAPDIAFLGTSVSSYYGTEVFLSAYVTEQGVQHVIVLRRDPGGAGNFAASPSTVVSVASSGAELPGASEPSVSADGQQVAFAAPVPAGQPGQQVAAGASEVWLHDTGQRTGQPGATTLVSCLPRARAGPCTAAANADSPSVCGNGQQVAFATTAAVAAHNGYPRTGTGTPRASPDASPSPVSGGISADQVYVRSVASQATVLISAPYGKKIAGGDGDSYAPAITEDGAAVAFVSQATDLTGASVPTGTANLYLRPTSATAGSTELASASGASLPAGTAIGLPSTDAHGRLVTFPASGALTADAPPGIGCVYTFDRLPALSAAPAAAGFGPVLIDSGTHAVTVTVTDSGPGPGTVTGVRVSGPFRVPGDRCAGVTLEAGSRCAVTVTFSPATAGRAAGVLTVTTQDDDEPPIAGSVPASATVPVPRLTVSPGVASAGEASQVRGTCFPPHQKITLTWSPGLGSATAASTAGGGFSTAMVIFPDDVTGPRTLMATGPAGVLARAPFLVQPAPVEPPFTASPAP